MSMTLYRPLSAVDWLQSGSTCNIWRHPIRPGIIIKSPRTDLPDREVQHKFCTEVKILQALGNHPRIVKFLGPSDIWEPTKNLLFMEAVNGDLQQYLHDRGGSIPQNLRLKWCKEAAEGLAHCHSRGVLHCDLRPDNILLNADLSLCLCDFGGSKNEECDGDGLPDYGFFDPRGNTLEVTEAMEIFGLGSVLYTIMLGTLPHGPSLLKTTEQRLEYYDKFERLGLAGRFPDTSEIIYGSIIRDCWTQDIKSAEDVYQRLIEIEKCQYIG